MNEKNKNIKDSLDEFLGEDKEKCTGNECIIKGDKSLIEVVTKKRIITEDGRQLLLN